MYGSTRAFEGNGKMVIIKIASCLFFSDSKGLFKRTDRYRLANSPFYACCKNVKFSRTVKKKKRKDPHLL